MEPNKEKLVKFYTNGKQNNDVLWGRTEPLHLEKSASGYNAPSSLLKSNIGLPGRGKLTSPPKHGTSNLFPEDHEPWQKRILDPGSEIVLKWNRVFIVSCLLALFIDPLYFYLPGVRGDQDSWCVKTDLNLRIVVTTFRTLADLFYMLHVAIKFRTAYVAPSSRVFGRGELVMDPKKIARRYIRTDFFIDLIATLPLPQIVIWFIIPATRNRRANHNNNALALIVLLQYIPRLYLIFPLSSELVKATGVVTKTAWAGAAYNLMLYMLASHVLGAAWYLLSIDRHLSCWKSICKIEKETCRPEYLDCSSISLTGYRNWADTTKVFKGALLMMITSSTEYFKTQCRKMSFPQISFTSTSIVCGGAYNN
ncbi:hypothetical protein OSB04_021080 [Centaurea solstitialis]|uniref:Ion transport domain-containing protein n=1 Tax=Centaurea solstitialis TaxID=347529 RepID=A0AA38W6H0_9ASTR|nr:hypothetical protein OSB04_021080 [Centaurea solstitialis]